MINRRNAKMRKFANPIMRIHRLESSEEIVSTSDCNVEAVACIECYATAAVCPTGFTCTELVCPRLDDID